MGISNRNAIALGMNYHARRILQAVFTVYVVISISFILIRMMPGGPIDYIRAELAQQTGSGESQERDLDALVELYTNIDPGKPMWEQYIDYMASMGTGDFGQSVWYRDPVIDILAEAIPWTILVSLVAIIFMYATGILLGALMAFYEGSNFDFGMTATLLWSNAIPYYVAALVLLYIFAFELGWFPNGGRVSGDVTPGVNVEFVTDILYHAALPIASLVLTGFGAGGIAMRANSIQVLGEDYIRVGNLRGLSDGRLATLYVARNAVLPLYTAVLIRIGRVLGGSIVLEVIFGYTGVGWYLFQAFSTRDYPLMMGGFILITVAVVCGLVVADLTYGLIDPRVNQGDANGQ